MHRAVLQANDEKSLKPIAGVGVDATVSDTVLTLTTFGVTLNRDCNAALISTKAQALNVTYDGSDPSAGASGDGHQYAAVTSWWVSRAMLENIRMVRGAGTDAEVRIEQFELGSPVKAPIS